MFTKIAASWFAILHVYVYKVKYIGYESNKFGLKFAKL